MKWLLLATCAIAIGTSPASAAVYESTPPATVTVGSGPYTVSAVSTGTDGYESLAYHTPADPTNVWHRCVGHNITFSVPDLPVGTYPIAIADDIDVNYWAAKGQTGKIAECQTTDPPASGWTVFWFTISSPPVPLPPMVVPVPVAPAAPVIVAPITTASTGTRAALCSIFLTAYRGDKGRTATAKKIYKRHHATKYRTKYVKALATQNLKRRQLVANRCIV